MNNLEEFDLIGNDVESKVLYENNDLIIIEQDSVKWIVTKDNEILMTVKDIGLLGGNPRKTKDYERI